MAKYIIFFICVFLGVTSSKLIKPRDLADEAEAQLEELGSIVQGEILTAHDNLQNLEIDFGIHSDNSFQAGAINLQQGKEQVDEQLETIKELGNTASVDISSCTNIREDVINRLPRTYTEQMGECVGVIGAEVLRVTRDARYIVDISIDKVQRLQFQLLQCRGDLLCISPIITEIQLDKIRLPQNIQTEVLATESMLTTQKVSVAACANDKVTQYVMEANSILDDITACVERLLS